MLISLLVKMVETFVAVPWALVLVILLWLVLQSVKVVHQGTFMIVEHFGEYSVLYFFDIYYELVENIKAWNSFRNPNY